MNDSERVEKLRQILKPVIDWYVGVEQDGEPDSSYLYDTTYEVFNENLRGGDFQSIIEILKPSSVGK
jgi:hypothetical protein